MRLLNNYNTKYGIKSERKLKDRKERKLSNLWKKSHVLAMSNPT